MTAVTHEHLGAWLLRCNPALTDLRTRFSTPARAWCVTDNYRSRLMGRGDTVLLWVSGQDRRYPRGIWGRGLITAPAEWAGSGLQVGLDLGMGDEPLVTDAELRASGIDDLEVQRMPQGSNPSWVSRERLHQIESMCAYEESATDGARLPTG